MTTALLLGLPGDRPGGLVLTVIYFCASGAAALAFGLGYAAVGVVLPRASLPLQAMNAFLRGTPLLLLVFVLAHVPWLPVRAAGFAALVLYSFSHVGEVLRSFLASYPRSVSEQARLMGISPLREWLELRASWTVWRAWNALFTHWVSLLKDTGVLVVLGIGELTTVAKILSELDASVKQWAVVLLTAAMLYLGTTVLLIQILQSPPGRLRSLARAEEGRT